MTTRTIPAAPEHLIRRAEMMLDQAADPVTDDARAKFALREANIIALCAIASALIDLRDVLAVAHGDKPGIAAIRARQHARPEPAR